MAAETEDSFDMEAFIEEIHGLPCIWDYTSEAHNNRLEKAKAWESLCYRFCDNYDAMDKKEKAEFVTKLQRKWRSLRDSYNRELKKQNSGIPKHRQYLYFTNLHFLRPLAERRIAENFIGDFDEDDFMTQHSTDESKPPSKRKRSSAAPAAQQESSSSKQQQQLSAYLPEFGPKVDMTVEPTSLPPSQPMQSSDGDWHFLLSLYEHFKNIDSRSKLVAKMEILNVIHKHTRTQPPWGYEGGHQYNNNGFSVSYGARQSSGPVLQPRSSTPSASESD